MVTIVLLGYIACSIYFTVQNVRGHWTWDGYVKPKRPALAIIEGFLLLPLLILVLIWDILKHAILAVILAAACLGALWITSNMP